MALLNRSARSARSVEEVLTIARQIGSVAEPHAAQHDRDASFVEEGYQAIKEARYGAIGVPQEFGGDGHDLRAICRAQAIMAGGCVNTSLAIAMHQHNVLAMAWRWRQGDKSVESVLRRIAGDGLILSSSGSADLANPGVVGTWTDGGIKVTGQKRFCSGVPGADVVATMAAVDDEQGRRVVTVLVPASDPGFRIIPDWDSMGMRGSGSNPVSFTDVFVPQSNILYLDPLSAPADEGGGEGGEGSNGHHPRRPRRARRPADGTRLPALQIALAVIASVYYGAAVAVRERALRIIAAGPDDVDPGAQRLAGLVTTETRSAWWALDALIGATNDKSVGTEAHFVTTMIAKRQVILSSIRTVELSMELLGSRSYMRARPFEQALRDVRAGITHPLSPEKTLVEVGRSALRYMAEQ